MACRLFGAKPLSKQIPGYCQFDPYELCNFNQNTKNVIHENASEIIVGEMAAILSRGRWVKNREQDHNKQTTTDPCELYDIFYAYIPSIKFNISKNRRYTAVSHQQKVNYIWLIAFQEQLSIM